VDRILGVAIGLATVCLLFSVLASHLQELWASFSARRAAALEIALSQMLSEPLVTSSFFAHPLVQSISFSPTRGPIFRRSAPDQPRPTYIASDLFSKVLQSVLAVVHGVQGADLPTVIARMPESRLKQRLETVILGVEGDAKACNAALEKWYDDTMERINGLYKRNTQVVLFILGLFLAVAFNVNILKVSATLWSSSAARDEVTAVAQLYGCKDLDSCKSAEYQSVREQLEKNLKSLPLGYGDGGLIVYWQGIKDEPMRQLSGEIAFSVGGWLLMAIAISLGAPFWFDLVNKLINVRMVGQKPPSGKDTSAARQ
jgi:hypothetical protein